MKFNHTAHKELWNWLADNPDKKKHEWPEWDFNGGKHKEIMGECFACQYAMSIKLINETCKKCPLVEHYEKGNTCLNGLFNQWDYECQNLQKRSGFARQIANLPVREGVECE